MNNKHIPTITKLATEPDIAVFYTGDEKEGIIFDNSGAQILSHSLGISPCHIDVTTILCVGLEVWRGMFRVYMSFLTEKDNANHQKMYIGSMADDDRMVIVRWLQKLQRKTGVTIKHHISDICDGMADDDKMMTNIGSNSESYFVEIGDTYGSRFFDLATGEFSSPGYLESQPANKIYGFVFKCTLKTEFLYLYVHGSKPEKTVAIQICQLQAHQKNELLLFTNIIKNHLRILKK